MRNVLEVAQEKNLNLIEISILIELEKKYPQTVFIEEIPNNPSIKENMNNLIIKGLVEERWHKYRIRKD